MPQALIAPLLGAVAAPLIGDAIGGIFGGGNKGQQAGGVAQNAVGAIGSGLTAQQAGVGNEQMVKDLVQNALGVVSNSSPQSLQRYLSLASNTKNPSLDPNINPAQMSGYGLGASNTKGTTPTGVDYSSVLAALPKAG